MPRSMPTDSPSTADAIVVLCVVGVVAVWCVCGEEGGERLVETSVCFLWFTRRAEMSTLQTTAAADSAVTTRTWTVWSTGSGVAGACHAGQGIVKRRWPSAASQPLTQHSLLDEELCRS